MRITLIALGLVSLSCSSEKGLTVYNQAPSVTIFDPFDDEVFDEGEVVGFSARIGDDQDPVDSLVRVWRSDRHDLGGAELSLSADGIATMTTGVLGLGAHTISLTVIDSDGQETTDSVRITLATPSDDADADADADTDADADADADADGGDPLVDQDGDGFAETVDCDDLDSQVYPGAEEYPYDGIDQDCDGEDLIDQDGDGADAQVAGGDDCDDLDPSIYPGAEEVCDGEDNDCDLTVDEPDATGCATWWEDADDDGFGSDVTQCLCGPSGDFTADNNDDCLDSDPDVNPDHTDFETLPRSDGGWDWDCNGVVEEQWTDVGSCSGTLFCDSTPGWLGSIPACGVEHGWVIGCSGGTCDESLDPGVRGCR